MNRKNVNSCVELVNLSKRNHSILSLLIEGLLKDIQVLCRRVQFLESTIQIKQAQFNMASNKINELEEIISEFSESNTDEPNKTKFPMAGNQNTRKLNEIGQCPSSEIPPPPRPLHSLENRKRTLDSCAIDDESFYSAKRSFPKVDDQHLSEIQMQDASNLDDSFQTARKMTANSLRRSISVPAELQNKKDSSLSPAGNLYPNINALMDNFCPNVTMRRQKDTLSTPTTSRLTTSTSLSILYDRSSCSNYGALTPFIPRNCQMPMHNFISHRNFLQNYCTHCNELIRFGVMYNKCTRCKTKIHENCVAHFVLPCATFFTTPTRVKKNVKKRIRPRLGDFCADSRPMIPQIIGLCVFHLEKNEINEDLYLMNGDCDEIESIIDLFKFKLKTMPNLDKFHPINIAGAVKMFLERIRDPVIPFSYGEEIISAVGTPKGKQNLSQILNDLPIAHKDTLTYLCRHFNHIISVGGFHTKKSISQSMGPVIFGASRSDPTKNLTISKEASCTSLNSLLELYEEDE